MPFPTGHLFLPPGEGISGRAVCKSCILPPLGASPCHHLLREEGAREERPPPWLLSAQKPQQNAPDAGAQQTSATAGAGSGLFIELEQTEMNFQIAPFFSQAPSYRFLCGGAPGIWNLICTPSTRPSGSQRWRGCSAASTKDGCRWCRLLPALPTAAPPGPCSSWGATEPWEGLGAPRGAFGAFLQCHKPLPHLVKDGPCLPIASRVVFRRENKGSGVEGPGML